MQFVVDFAYFIVSRAESVWDFCSLTIRELIDMTALSEILELVLSLDSEFVGNLFGDRLDMPMWHFVCLGGLTVLCGWTLIKWILPT